MKANELKTTYVCKNILTNFSAPTIQDELDSWTKIWVLHGNSKLIWIRRQQWEGLVMDWVNITSSKILSPFKVEMESRSMQRIILSSWAKHFLSGTDQK